jgi:hypothetical protein
MLETLKKILRTTHEDRVKLGTGDHGRWVHDAVSGHAHVPQDSGRCLGSQPTGAAVVDVLTGQAEVVLTRQHVDRDPEKVCGVPLLDRNEVAGQRTVDDLGWPPGQFDLGGDDSGHV